MEDLEEKWGKNKEGEGSRNEANSVITLVSSYAFVLIISEPSEVNSVIILVFYLCISINNI